MYKQELNLQKNSAEGKNISLRHGQYLQYDKEVPLANLFVSLLLSMDFSDKAFADSTGIVNEIFV